jgi:hypothetical protein
MSLQAMDDRELRSAPPGHDGFRKKLGMNLDAPLTLRDRIFRVDSGAAS